MSSEGVSQFVVHPLGKTSQKIIQVLVWFVKERRKYRR
jgi:hypothetical protein